MFWSYSRGYPGTKPGCFGHTRVSTRVSSLVFLVILGYRTWLFWSQVPAYILPEYIIMYKIDCSGMQNFSLPATRVFSRVGCGARKGLACTPRCKCGSRPGSVARTLGVQGREIWQVTTGSLSDQLEPTRLVQTPKTLFCHFSPLCCCFFRCHSSRQSIGSHGTTPALQAFPFCDSHERCFCVWVRERAVCVRVCHCRILQRSRNQEQSQKQRSFTAIFRFCYAVCCCCCCCCCCVPVAHRRL